MCNTYGSLLSFSQYFRLVWQILERRVIKDSYDATQFLLERQDAPLFQENLLERHITCGYHTLFRWMRSKKGLSGSKKQ